MGTAVEQPSTETTPIDIDGHILVGKGEQLQTVQLEYANRHGLIAGATGTGKTVSLQVLAEGFSRQGVPVFVADVKGDLSGISQAGSAHPKVDERVEKIGIESFEFEENPTIFWDLYGKQGHPIRTTITEMGPVLMARLLNLSDAQEGVLSIAFALADDEGMPLLDFQDLRALIHFVGESRKELSSTYGHVSSASVGAIQRKLLQFEQEGADQFFGEPALDISELMRTTTKGNGYINILAADELIRSPKLYSTFLLWMLSELFETLPEVGDPDKPKLVFFFDEAHLLFDDAPKVLLQKVEQVCRLIRSKGVGVYFVTQSPSDVPTDVLGQLGNRLQHALRAFTPKDKKAVKTAADTFRPNPRFSAEEKITQLGVGEALVSTLQEDGVPSMVDDTLIRPPLSRIGPATEVERKAVMNDSPIGSIYDAVIDRESAHEMLAKRAEEAAKKAEEAERTEALERERAPKRKSNRMGYGETLTKSVLRSVGRQIANKIVRGILGNILK